MTPILDFFEDVGIVNVILDGVGDGVVSAHILIMEGGFPLPFHLLFFDLPDHRLSHLLFVVLLHIGQLSLLLVLAVLQLLERLVLLVFVRLLHLPQVLFVLELIFQGLVHELCLVLLSPQMLVMRLEKRLAPIVVLYDVLLFLDVLLLIVINETLPDAAQLGQGQMVHGLI